MTQRTVDTTSPPQTVAEWQALKAALGITGVLLYEPGWGAPMVSNFAQNTVPAGQSALAAGLDVGLILDPNHPTLAGLAGGGVTAMKVGVEMAIATLQQIGVDPTGCLHFDLEESDWTADEALCRELSAIFCEANQGMPSLPSQYGNPNLLAGIASLPPAQRCEFVWIASYLNQTAWPSSPASVPQLSDILWNTPGQRGWQWHGGQAVQGHDYDFSVVDFPLCKVAPAPSPAPDPAPAPPAGPTLLSSGEYAIPGGAKLTIP
ncbi:MAG TPA: hypothetical protein VMV23_05455 [Candidatus Nanopelagicaceae bacterium]|nr:hypothetical protein [Candidatus Nanopelagicaceae bacterium]